MSEPAEVFVAYETGAIVRGPNTSRRVVAAWNCLRGIPTADLERIAAAPGDAARLAQLATAADAAHQRAKEPK